MSVVSNRIVYVATFATCVKILEKRSVFYLSFLNTCLSPYLHLLSIHVANCDKVGHLCRILFYIEYVLISVLLYLNILQFGHNTRTVIERFGRIALVLGKSSFTPHYRYFFCLFFLFLAIQSFVLKYTFLKNEGI
jgi:hypothetical protein